ncbi:hypothetical protein DVK85_12235 [Flavobacterium arcticum]|uniref:Uncharacterized protein n=1 Tax=Flavobacterium arcticum TaxID=1784713 RepID=A0A345HEE5_9FLAO|nr:hypothetical protein [Flavobacterium arcticum]AXG74955.1 hypothetical protein DVK85_12235 [Flavobacterium arcticum]KAF2506508.1 hypothetical protein E0W72_12810 [Flavobacterium arcticum]
MAQRNTAYIDKLNIGLMFVALLPAILLPFELFLFVYAILGPLHYLTEINWLHKKQYFTSHKYDYLGIIVFILAVGLLVFFHSKYKFIIPILIFITFGASLSMVLFKSIGKKLITVISCVILGGVLFYFFREHFRIIFSILLPTIVHVFIFTGMFILVGALRSNSSVALLSLITFIACSVVTFLIPPTFSFSSISEYIYGNYSSFRNINRILMRFFSFIHVDDIRTSYTNTSYIKEGDLTLFFSDNGVRVMRFIAFAYTYHYLNWFSKTSIIQWHNTKKRNLIFIIAIWIISVLLYLYNYKTGLKWLYILSLGHVLLEFPLNFRSFIEVKKQVSLKIFNYKQS